MRGVAGGIGWRVDGRRRNQVIWTLSQVRLDKVQNFLRLEPSFEVVPGTDGEDRRVN
jgi:hypothetical protein